MAAKVHPLFKTPLPDGWKLVTTDEIKSAEKSSCVAGPFGSNISSKFFVERGVPIIRGGNLRDDLTRFVPEGFAFVSEEQARKYKAQHVRSGDLVFTCWGTVGQVGLIPSNGPFPEYVISNKQLKLRPNLEIADPVYLFFYFAGPKMVQHVLGKAIGAAVPGINLGILKELPVVLPPLPVQRRIAAILSAYDELMENSQRRIRILEAMARALYREWFVHFRFPGHEKHPRVASPLGDIPQGWEAIPFETLLSSMTGGDWGSDQPTETESAEVTIVRGTDFDEVAYGGKLRAPVRYIRPSSLKSRGLRPGEVIVENSINAKSRCVGTTLLVDCRVLARIGRDAVAASFCKVFRLHDPRLAPLVHLHFRRLREDARLEYYQNVAANGIGNFQAQKFAKEEHLILPKDESLRSKLLGGIATMFESISVLSSKLSNLRRTRDLLLPRLLSGQVELHQNVSNMAAEPPI